MFQRCNLKWSFALVSSFNKSFFYIFSKTDNSNGLTVLRKCRKIHSWPLKVEQLCHLIAFEIAIKYYFRNFHILLSQCICMLINPPQKKTNLLIQHDQFCTKSTKSKAIKVFILFFYRNFPFLNFYYFFLNENILIHPKMKYWSAWEQ